MVLMMLWSVSCLVAPFGYYFLKNRCVQQGAPLGPLLFCLVLQQVVSVIAEDADCASLLFHKWYINDGVVAGPIAAIARVLAIIQERGPPLGLYINIAKCNYSV